MSSLLEQAVIDAQSLREAALRNAETAILEKYSDEIKGAIDVMLEAEIGFPEDEFVSPEEEVAVPALAAAEGEDLCGCPEAGEEVEWELSLDDLKAMSDEMETGDPMGQEALAQRWEQVSSVLVPTPQRIVKVKPPQKGTAGAKN